MFVHLQPLQMSRKRRSSTGVLPWTRFLWSGDSAWVPAEDKMWCATETADGCELCFSHRSLLAHRLACQANQRKLSRFSCKVGKSNRQRPSHSLGNNLIKRQLETFVMKQLDFSSWSLIHFSPSLCFMADVCCMYRNGMSLLTWNNHSLWKTRNWDNPTAKTLNCQTNKMWNTILVKTQAQYTT